MKIKLREQYKSLFPFESEELSSLTLIIGKNGSGKSQLLYLLENKFKNNSNSTDTLIHIESIYSIQSEGIIKKSNSSIQNDVWKSAVKQRLHSFRDLSSSELELGINIAKNNLSVSKIPNSTFPLLSESEEYVKAITRYFSNHASAEEKIAANKKGDEDRLKFIQYVSLKKFNNYEIRQMLDFVLEVCAFTNKNEKELVDADFYKTPVREHLLDEHSLFMSAIETIFYNYANRRYLNDQASYFKSNRGDSNTSLSFKEFIDKYPEPWVLINDLLERNNIDFYFKGVTHDDFHPDVKIDFSFHKKSTDQEVAFSDLSSGEKVIIGLIIKLFTSEYYSEKLRFPDLLILDEPDAHLHPEMSKLLLEILESTFVNKFNIKVIMTTHSPSTVALAPEGSVYQLINGVHTSLRKIKRDDALDVLTAGLVLVTPTTKYVLVEGKDDQPFYLKLYRKLLDDKLIPATPSLGFVKGTGSGSVLQMSNWYEGLSEAGFGDRIKGVIDRDKSNVISDGIYVLERYSIENYLLDPFLIIFNTKNIPESIKKFDIKEPEEHKIKQLSQQDLQVLCDAIFSQVESLGDPITSDKILLPVEYANGYVLKYPTWFIKQRGKNILGLFQKKFGQMLNPVSLSNTAMRVGMIPTDLVNMFLSLQE